MGRKREWTDERLHKLGKKLVSHCQLDGVWHITSFEVKEELSDGQLEYLYRTYPKVFLPYYTRALRILGNKIMKKSMDGGGDRWVIKTFLPRYLSCRKWIKEDLEMEALTKAEATKAANVQEISPWTQEIMDNWPKFLEWLKENESSKS